uniref:Uncharacterized protein n=1 Tax=Oryza punctata TaxID=4537 RepID=A0A0E0KNT1_ORYPU
MGADQNADAWNNNFYQALNTFLLLLSKRRVAELSEEADEVPDIQTTIIATKTRVILAARAKEKVCVGAEEEVCVGAGEEGVSCTLRIILPVIPEHYSPAGAILQAGFLAVISVFCIGNNLADIKVRNIRKSQELMVLHFSTRYWSHWCTTKISLPLINWMEVT